MMRQTVLVPLVVGLLLAFGALSMLAPAAQANPIAGAVYTGTHSGGGTVSFEVSTDGTEIIEFVAEDLWCNIGSITIRYTMQIDNKSFAWSSDPMFFVSGSFPRTGRAEGTLHGALGDCVSDTLTWTASALAGDASCNALVDARDAALVLQYDAALVASLPCQQNADVSGDGNIDAIDAALILQYTAGLIPSLPP